MLSKLLKIDKSLTDGREVILEKIKGLNISGGSCILDVGCGKPRLLRQIKEQLDPGNNMKMYGIGCKEFQDKNIIMDTLDVEYERFPYESGSFDLVICNHVLEHLKSYMWTLSEMIRVVRVGGYLFLGVPNLASLHNRLLLSCGRQPTTIGLSGPHVRAFTPHAFAELLERDKALSVVSILGSGFYPFRPLFARWLAKLLPTMAVSSCYLVQWRAPHKLNHK